MGTNPSQLNGMDLDKERSACITDGDVLSLLAGQFKIKFTIARSELSHSPSLGRSLSVSLSTQDHGQELPSNLPSVPLAQPPPMSKSERIDDESSTDLPLPDPRRAASLGFASSEDGRNALEMPQPLSPEAASSSLAVSSQPIRIPARSTRAPLLQSLSLSASLDSHQETGVQQLSQQDQPQPSPLEAFDMKHTLAFLRGVEQSLGLEPASHPPSLHSLPAHRASRRNSQADVQNKNDCDDVDALGDTGRDVGSDDGDGAESVVSHESALVHGSDSDEPAEPTEPAGTAVMQFAKQAAKDLDLILRPRIKPGMASTAAAARKRKADTKDSGLAVKGISSKEKYPRKATAYGMFASEMRQQIRAKQPGLASADVTRSIKGMFTKLSPDSLKMWATRAAEHNSSTQQTMALASGLSESAGSGSDATDRKPPLVKRQRHTRSALAGQTQGHIWAHAMASLLMDLNTSAASSPPPACFESDVNEEPG
ncbi:hypothetical protein BC831DRAFT_476254 [Entophlyctis helioformis]|nr:hypothetical protein BC831DRAFT_476254 [Entophlyctis helioformis]